MDRVVVVFAGGEPVAPPVSWVAMPAFDDALVVAADAGVHLADAMGLRVDVVVGDMDSITADALHRADAAGARIERHPVDKDATDLEIALEVALREGASRIVVVGGAGGRLDHLLANVALLASARFASTTIEACVGPAWVGVVHGGGPALAFTGAPGETVSLIPAGGDARNVVTEGLRYPLRGDDLRAGSTRGVSNVVDTGPVSVRLGAGTLVVVRARAGQVAEAGHITEGGSP